ncbi:MAG TPA: polysaccharide deacetylase family protein, partial [Roseiflexaceae bacterium]|nr:polysaccharide deacetylase family protein [Roseiflexaceae bacterium]
VLGHIPLHPESPRTLISSGVQSWAEHRTRRLSSPGAQLTLSDLLTGQISLSRATFQRVGGFDTKFTHAGSFGMEDIDFGYRLLLAGYTIVFNPRAISWQYYVIEPRQYLRQWRQAGRADVVFVRKHPEQAETIFPAYKLQRRINRLIWRPLAALPLLAPSLIALLHRLTLILVKHLPHDARTFKLFFAIRYMEYWRGVWEVGGIPQPRPLRVLAYHAIANLAGAPVLAAYGVPPHAFHHQLASLQRFGYHFISPDEFLRFLQGRAGLPRRPVLVTFDDCYEDLLTSALPVLAERAIPAVAFAVSGQLGGTNAWDVVVGGPQLQLLSATGLRTLAARGIEIGAHSRTHRPLTRLTPPEQSDEIAGSAQDLVEVGLARPRFFAYPHGEHNHSAEQAVQAAGLQAAFTVEPGLVRPGQHPYRVPRIEILSSDLSWKLHCKVAFIAHWPLLTTILRWLRWLRRPYSFRHKA